MKIANTKRKVAQCAVMASALSAMVYFAGVAEASAATVKQVDTTTDSITAKFTLNETQLNPEIGKVEVLWTANSEWEELSADKIQSLTSEGVIIVGLDAGIRPYEIRFYFTYNTPYSVKRNSSYLSLTLPIEQLFQGTFSELPNFFKGLLLRRDESRDTQCASDKVFHVGWSHSKPLDVKHFVTGTLCVTLSGGVSSQARKRCMRLPCAASPTAAIVIADSA